MTDTRLRRAARAAESGDTEAQARLLLERVRAGRLSRERLELAASVSVESATSSPMNMRIWLECKKCGQVSEHSTVCKRGRTYVRRECNGCRKTDPRESTYRTWRAMLARCTDPKCKEWRWYGGRGISVCDEWRDFDRFVADMGLRPFPTASIERLDNNAGYGPANCKWIERNLQAANQRSNRLLTYNGQTKHLSEWARQTGIDRRVLGWRLKKGWPPEEVLGFEPHRRRGSCRKPGPHSQHGCSLGALDGEAP